MLGGEWAWFFFQSLQWSRQAGAWVPGPNALGYNGVQWVPVPVAEQLTQQRIGTARATSEIGYEAVYRWTGAAWEQIASWSSTASA